MKSGGDRGHRGSDRGDRGGGGGGSMSHAPNMSALNSGNNFGLSPQLLKGLNIDGPVVNQVFIANLDYKINKEKLEDVFRLAGRVMKVDIKIDKEGKSRGLATVTFEHPLEAVQAVSLFHDQRLYERTMMVRMDKSSDIPPPNKPHLPGGLKTIGKGLGMGGTSITNLSDLAHKGILNSMMGSMMSGVDPANFSMGVMQGMGNMGGGMMNMVGMNNMMGMNNMGMGMNNMGNMASQNMGGNMGNMPNMGNMGSMENMGGMNSMGNMSMNNMSNMGGMSGMSNMGNNMSSSMGSGGMGDSMSGGMGMGGVMSNMGMSSSSMDNSLMGSRSMGGSGSNNTISPLTSSRGGSMKNEPCTLFVRNLPFTFTWQNLRDRFQDCGDVKYAEVKLDSAKGRMYGMVRFGTPEDARRAVNLMDGARIEGHIIEVRLDN